MGENYRALLNQILSVNPNPIKYIVEHERDRQWGLSVCTVGFETISPESPYPIRKHGTDYYFSVEKGRILYEYQLIYIPEGGGCLRIGKLKEL